MSESAVFVLVLILFFLFTETIKLSLGLNSYHCVDKERQALLSFKQGLIDPSDRLSSWVGRNCCTWEGVGCHHLTGRVVKLDLRNPYPLDLDQYELNPQYIAKVAAYMPYNKACLEVREVNESLLDLKHLNYLDLSWNNFTGIQIPSFFGSFQKLTYLNLSSAWFGGTVPHQLGNLTSLQSLDLSLANPDFLDTPMLIVDNLQWISNFSSLQHLVLRKLHLSKPSSNFSPVINSFNFLENLTSLVTLDLSHNYLEGPIPIALRNLTSLKVLLLTSCGGIYSNGPILGELKNLNNLEILDLSYNRFERKAIESSGNLSLPSIRDSLKTFYMAGNDLGVGGYLPNWLYQLRNLENLDLSVNSFHGPIPTTFGSFRSLKELDLTSNRLNGSIPSSLGQLSTLEVLRLRGNEFSGSIPASLGRLSVLRVLDIRGSQLSGQIPTSFERLSKLTHLLLMDNQLSGDVPTYFGRQSNMTHLLLSYNQLNGTILESLGLLSELVELDLSSNSLKGVLTERHFSRHSKLEYLSLGKNSLSLKTRSSWVPPFQLKTIDLESCKVGPQFPEWLRTQTQFRTLILSKAGISAPMPNWFDYLSSNLYYLDLSHNQISGTVPKLSKLNTGVNMELYLSSNNFEGPFPHFLPSVAILDLSKNKISGPIPKDISRVLPTVSGLFLFDNLINGSIPSSLCEMQELSALYLSKNNLSGDLPQCLGDLPLHFLDLADNNLSGTIPSSIGHSLCDLSTLRLSNNHFNGKLPSNLQNCTYLSVLDIGDNSLSGKIPAWVGRDLPNLTILRLRSNNFTGTIPLKLCGMADLRIIDLAKNNLSGIIPHCFGNFSAMIFGVKSEVDTPSPSIPMLGQVISNAERLMQMIKGIEREYSKTLPFLVNMDLSRNDLVGQVPDELTNLARLIGLNLSGNHLEGNIPEKIGQMKSLESLDFSVNHLSGPIPQSISTISYLSYLNVSYNNLSGPIPSGGQLQTFIDTSIYEGNHDLCGSPLEKKCPGDEPPHPPRFIDGKGRGDDSEFKFNVFYIGMVIGFVVGFWGVWGVLLFKKTWRYAYFQFVDDIKDRLLLATEILKKKLKQKAGEE